MEYKINLVKNAMLAVQRYPWEQGTCMQAIYEMGDIKTAVAMAHDAVLRQKEDGRLAVINNNIAVTDPASNGEVVFRAYQITGDVFYKNAAEKMLNYLLYKAPKTKSGIIYHNEISFHEGYSKYQIWSDASFMAPPFLAVMGHIRLAANQVKGYVNYLRSNGHKLVNHIYDEGNGVFVREKLWATGNGWTLMGIARIVETALNAGENEIAQELTSLGTEILDEMLLYSLPDGRFHDILDDEASFIEGTAAMMMCVFIYRMCLLNKLDAKYIPYAERVINTMENYVDDYGIIHEVCGCPDFVSVGTSAESMASYLMMHAWRQKYINKKEK